MTIEHLGGIFGETFKRFGEDKATNIAASLAFYAMLSISPVLVLAVSVASMVLGEESARRSLLQEVESAMGRQGADFIATLIENQALSKNGLWPTALSIGIILFGASALFQHLKEAVASIWGETPPQKGFWAMVVQRVIAGVMVPVFGIMMLAWFALEGFLAYWAPGPGGTGWWGVLTFAVSVAFFTFVAAAWIRFLVPAKLDWRDILPGGLLIGVTFTLGKLLLALYFTLAKVSAAYGSAGAIVILLLWIYYNAQIFFFGIEFTQALALDRGRLARHREQKIKEKDERRRQERAA